jgi:uncharacterized iron-regulated membrane protein
LAFDLKRRGARVWRTLSNFTLKQWLTLAAFAVIAFAVILYATGSLSSFLHASRFDRQEARHDQAVSADTAQADSHEANADRVDTARQVKEAQAADAEREADDAGRRAAATIAPTRKARSDYEKARARAVDDLPSVPDDRICAELSRRNINFSECPR